MAAAKVCQFGDGSPFPCKRKAVKECERKAYCRHHYMMHRWMRHGELSEYLKKKYSPEYLGGLRFSWEGW